MRVVLVTGASGVLGRRLICRLGAAGWHTRALVHETAAPEADEQTRGSFDDVSSLGRATAGVHAVVHLAGLTHSRDPEFYARVNTNGTAAVVSAAGQAGVERIVYVSTRAVSPTGGAYSVSKLRAEEVVRASSIPHVIVRLAEIYGGGTQEGIDRMVRAARSGSILTVIGDGSYILCPIHIDDAAAALVGALEAPVAIGKTYTVGGPCLTLGDFADECQRVLGGGRRVRIPLVAVRAAGVVARRLPLPLYPDQLSRLRSLKEQPTPYAERELGFHVRPLSEGLRAAD
jgi:NADH dehydrogenase